MVLYDINELIILYLVIKKNLIHYATILSLYSSP